MQEVELAYQDAQSLYRAYMPFIKGGGLFVKSNTPFKSGELIRLTLILPNNTRFSPFNTLVIWYGSNTVSDEEHIPGYALQIAGDDGEDIQSKILKMIQDLDGQRDW
jgi:type IV pilus assembly protein PilZ